MRNGIGSIQTQFGVSQTPPYGSYLGLFVSLAIGSIHGGFDSVDGQEKLDNLDFAPIDTDRADIKCVQDVEIDGRQGGRRKCLTRRISRKCMDVFLR